MSLNIMNRIIAGTIFAGFISAFAVAAPLSPDLEQALHTAPQDSLVQVVVFFADWNAKTTAATAAANPSFNRAQRINTVSRFLKESSALTLNRASASLTSIPSVRILREHWITAAVTVETPVAALPQILNVPGVVQIIGDVHLQFDEPIDVKAAGPTTAAVSSQLQLLKVPFLWQRGLTGKGRLVCSFDTGVQGTHPALAGKWRGVHGDTSSAWFSTTASDSSPIDRAGHGTHTMGIMVGSVDADSFGVAPDAEWIAAGVIDQGKPLSGTISDILQAFEWALNPDGDTATTNDVPDVILNSWGIPTGLFAPCDASLWTAIDNVEAAGIVTIFAAGNEGPDLQTVRSPADRASTPLSSFSVGAVDNSLVIGSFSSRGPSSCSGDIKPEIVAPGVAIRSSTKGSAYALMTGTSMAAPFVAGLVALCRQYNPDLTVDQIKSALLQAAQDLGTPGEDNAYGHGIIDASKLLDLLPSVQPLQVSIIEQRISDDGIADPGDSVALNLRIRTLGRPVNQIAMTMVPRSPGVTMLEGQAQFLFTGEEIESENLVPLRFVVDSSVTLGSTLDFELYLMGEPGGIIDSIPMSVQVGLPLPGSIATMSTGRVSLTISDFGQYGLGPGSVMNAGGTGLLYSSSQNLLYESGVILGNDNGALISAVRDETGSIRQSPFVVQSPLTPELSIADNGIKRTCRFSAPEAHELSDITISQQAITFVSDGRNQFVLFRFYLINTGAQDHDGVSFGLLTDIDLSASDRCGFLDESQTAYVTDNQFNYVGLTALTPNTLFTTSMNASGKSPLTAAQKQALLTPPGMNIDNQMTGDVLLTLAAGPYSIPAGDSVEVALALVAGNSQNNLLEASISAQIQYGVVTSVGPEDHPIPSTFTLAQNYPNPFNPATTISFDLPAGTNVRLEVFNVLGQRIALLQEGYLPAGTYKRVFSAGTDGAGQASGVYFYRLTAGSYAETRKMMLLK